MYTIALCDDEKMAMDHVIAAVQRILDKNDIKFELTCFNNGFDLIKNLQEGCYYDLIMLDIMMPEINGIDLTRHIKENCETSRVILVSSSTDYVFRGYDVGVDNYLVKPLDEKRTEEVLLKNYKKCRESSFFHLKVGDTMVKIYYHDVEYIESFRKKLTYHVAGKAYEVYGKLDDFCQEMPPEDFCRCHKSYVINLDKVTKIKRYSFTTASGKTVPISKACYPDSQDRFLAFLKG